MKGTLSLIIVRIGDYFKELHLGEYSSLIFEHKNKLYLNVSTTKYEAIAPEDNTGFAEIKGSDFYKALEEALEEFESKNE